MSAAVEEVIQHTTHDTTQHNALPRYVFCLLNVLLQRKTNETKLQRERRLWIEEYSNDNKVSHIHTLFVDQCLGNKIHVTVDIFFWTWNAEYTPQWIFLCTKYPSSITKLRSLHVKF